MYVRGASGTYVWLGILFVTTVAMHQMSPEFEAEFLRQRSTNIHELSHDPERVLIAGAMARDGCDPLVRAAADSRSGH